jgi:hypothetical protein
VARESPLFATEHRGAYPGVELPGERWERQTYEDATAMFGRYAPLVVELERMGYVYRVHPTRFEDIVAQIRLGMNILYAINAVKFEFYVAALHYLFRPQIADLFRRR